ncbi:MAG: aminotransferase class I/II-fold pyridoxal phosphate-dependent enzyme [Deltaproteobacteria bacterium]|nr:aminotransferase class I/II-fold pyridoxal phosphate-dependent enzyme [Deltaproteobacteria bacterium]MBI3295361.1 aminotransferase class I/II-fold pyridoxal phosphate-dependent enzyme [Deltaproteobacteria bacterium]
MSQNTAHGPITHKDIFQKCREFTDPDKVKALGVYPYFRPIEGTAGNQVIVGGRRKIMIGSNNYLGLANDERVIDAAQAALRKYGSGCTGSRFLNGTLDIHGQLEEALAQFLEREACLVFSTGFFANEGALVTLCEEGDFILCDRENHASIVDGCRASRAKTVPFAHNSAESLRRRLKRLPPEGGKLVVMDGVFSMSGDIIDLPAMKAVADEYGAKLYVDEAHSLGVVGPKGKGTVHQFGLNDSVDLVMGTFSKSLGSQGGFIAGPRPIIEYLKHKCRCFIFTASLAPAISGGVLKALELMQEETWRIDALWKNTHRMHEGFRSIGFNIGTTQTPIVPLLIGSEMKAFVFSQKLFDAGIFTTPAIFPAVRYGEAIVRTSYMATHTEDELSYVLETCERVGKELGIFEDAAYTGESKRRNSGYDLNLSDQEGPSDIREPAGTGSDESAVCAPVSG